MIFNTDNVKFYIGSSTNLNRRFGQHRYDLRNNIHSNEHLQRAFNKYGEDKFRFYKIKICTKNELLEVEQMYINELCPEYNMLPVTGSSYGYKHSLETRRKLSEAQKKSWKNNSIRENRISGLVGRKFSHSARLRMSQAHKNSPLSEKVLLNLDRKGTKHSNDTLRKMSEIKTGKTHSKVTCKKISNLLKGRKLSYETRLKMSEAQKRRWANWRAAQALIKGEENV